VRPTARSEGPLGQAAILVGCRTGRESREEAQESLEELARLLDTAGGTEVHREVCEVRRPMPATFIGSGTIDRLKSLIDGFANPVRCVVFDVDLTPVQQRNLEDRWETMVMDRTGLILDIFARRARSAEGKLQVELAQLQYLMPRLRGMWTHLSRQGAGIGTRGPGEKVLEVDRRRIRQRISLVKKRLEDVRRTRGLHRRTRRRREAPTIALIGYTNAGKSTLLNVLTGADVFVEDRLFATLDPTTRALRLPGNVPALLSDTVGFIRKLPHHLVESFKATFEEVALADLLVHIVDAAHPRMEEQVQAVQQVLDDMDLSDRPMLTVYNKIDQVESEIWLRRLVEAHQPAVAISAKTGRNLESLLAMLAKMLGAQRRLVHLRVPLSRPDLIYMIRTGADVVEETEDGNDLLLTAWMDRRLADLTGEYEDVGDRA